VHAADLVDVMRLEALGLQAGSFEAVGKDSGAHPDRFDPTA
jgi:hypothetical protein